MPDMREGGLGTAACYLTVERLALQAGVESPFWDETSLLMGGCEEPWYKKPLTPRRLRSFLKRYGGSLPRHRMHPRRYGGNHGVLRGGDCSARHAHMGRRYIGADIRTHPYRVSRPHSRDLRIIR